MVWNKEEGFFQSGQVMSSWQNESNLPSNAQELLEEAFDTLVYLDEKLLSLEYSIDNNDLIRQVFGCLVRLYGLFWSLRSKKEFRMIKCH